MLFATHILDALINVVQRRNFQASGGFAGTLARMGRSHPPITTDGTAEMEVLRLAL